MSPIFGFFLVVITALLSTLLTVLIAQVTGLRSDMRGYAEEQRKCNDTQQKISERLLVLETEHKRSPCRFPEEE